MSSQPQLNHDFASRRGAAARLGSAPRVESGPQENRGWEKQLIEAGRFEVSEAVVSAELGGEGVLLDIATGLYYGLDETGSQIWRLVREGLGTSDICDRLFSEYDVDRERLRTDITGFLDQLEQNGLIRTRPGK